MIIKSINVILAYLIACIFTSICITLTYFWSPIIGSETLDTRNLLDMSMVVTVSIIIFSSPITLIAGLFAFFKKIASPYYYAFIGIFAIMTTLAFIPGLAGVEGDEPALWVPFMGVLAASAAGYLFWFLAIRRPQSKPQTQQI